MKKTTHTIPSHDLEHYRQTPGQDTKELLKKWAKHNYPIGAGTHSIHDTNPEKNEITIREA